VNGDPVITTPEELCAQCPREYTCRALAALGHAATLVELVRPGLLEELAGGGGALLATASQRASAVELARAACAFLKAANDARDVGLL
jgi:dienelactone hydrolase